MARPIKEPPILFGSDARRFEERMKNSPQGIAWKAWANQTLIWNRHENDGELIMTREEFQERCVVRRLTMDDTIAIFDCNDEDLNDFLLNEANLYR